VTGQGADIESERLYCNPLDPRVLSLVEAKRSFARKLSKSSKTRRSARQPTAVYVHPDTRSERSDTSSGS
jgi:hypothetical protein